MGRIAAIDFGLARIGLAISDAAQVIAQPLGAIKTGKDFKESAQRVVKELTRFDRVEQILIGLPLLLNGKEGDMAKHVRAFGAVLQEELSLPITYFDERLTSAQVERMLSDQGMSRKKRAERSDALAAATLLQCYLENSRQHDFTSSF